MEKEPEKSDINNLNGNESVVEESHKDKILKERTGDEAVDTIVDRMLKLGEQNEKYLTAEKMAEDGRPDKTATVDLGETVRDLQKDLYADIAGLTKEQRKVLTKRVVSFASDASILIDHNLIEKAMRGRE